MPSCCICQSWLKTRFRSARLSSSTPTTHWGRCSVAPPSSVFYNFAVTKRSTWFLTKSIIYATLRYHICHLVLLQSWFKNKAGYTAPSKITRDMRTDGRTDGPTDRRTDTTSYRDATAHLKRKRIQSSTLSIFPLFIVMTRGGRGGELDMGVKL